MIKPNSDSQIESRSSYGSDLYFLFTSWTKQEKRFLPSMKERGMIVSSLYLKFLLYFCLRKVDFENPFLRRKEINKDSENV